MTRTDREIWPLGRYELYDVDALEDERLNGFHTMDEAEAAQAAFPNSVILDRASRFAYGPNESLVMFGG